MARAPRLALALLACLLVAAGCAAAQQAEAEVAAAVDESLLEGQAAEVAKMGRYAKGKKHHKLHCEAQSACWWLAPTCLMHTCRCLHVAPAPA
jgi:hypothetical protein